LAVRAPGLQSTITAAPPPTPQVWSQRISLPTHPTHRHARCPLRGAPVPPRVPPSLITRPVRCRNVDLLSIDYALRPRLRPDYPWADHPAPGTLGLAVCKILTCILRYSYRHSHSSALHPRFHLSFTAADDAPLPPWINPRSAASAVGLSPGTFSARDHWTSELLRTRSRVAASKPTSWLSGRSHILVH
jgi:hypothetical protein